MRRLAGAGESQGFFAGSKFLQRYRITPRANIRRGGGGFTASVSTGFNGRVLLVPADDRNIHFQRK